MKKFRSMYLALAVVGGLFAAGGAQAAIVYSENFETGTATGWTMDGLWHVTSNFPSGGTYALGYVQDETQPSSAPDGNYDNEENWGTAFSSLIALGSGSTMSVDVVNFNECGGGDCEYDILTVGVSLDGSTIDHYLASSYTGDVADIYFDSADIENEDGYLTLLLNLSAYDNQNIYLAFYFDTLDAIANDYPGVRVDNIVVSSREVPEPAMLALFGMGLAGLGLARRKR